MLAQPACRFTFVFLGYKGIKGLGSRVPKIWVPFCGGAYTEDSVILLSILLLSMV